MFAKLQRNSDGTQIALCFCLNLFVSNPSPYLACSVQNVINGSAHHSDHHTAFNYNYGQYFTLWDRIGGSYQYPSALVGKGCVWRWGLGC